jgi:hypothetical protein
VAFLDPDGVPTPLFHPKLRERKWVKLDDDLKGLLILLRTYNLDFNLPIPHALLSSPLEEPATWAYFVLLQMNNR